MGCEVVKTRGQWLRFDGPWKRIRLTRRSNRWGGDLDRMTHSIMTSYMRRSSMCSVWRSELYLVWGRIFRIQEASIYIRRSSINNVLRVCLDHHINNRWSSTPRLLSSRHNTSRNDRKKFRRTCYNKNPFEHVHGVLKAPEMFVRLTMFSACQPRCRLYYRYRRALSRSRS